MGNYFRTTPQVEIVEEPVSVPRHDTFYAAIVATGQKGRDPGELYYPYWCDRVELLFMTQYKLIEMVLTWTHT